MKLVNKIRRKITPFDIGIFGLFAMLLLIVFLFFYRKSELVNIQIKVTDQNVLYAFSNPPSWYANSFKVGDEERDILGNVMTRIEKVDIHNFDNFTKEVILDLKLRATYDPRTKTYSARGKDLAVGTSMKFTLPGVTFDGTIVSTPNSKIVEPKIFLKSVQVLVRAVRDDKETDKVTYHVEPRALESIKQGEKILNTNGDVLAEVTNIKVYPSEKSTADMWGRLHLTRDPIYKDALITLNMRTEAIGNDMFVFTDFPLRVGGAINLVFNDKFTIGTIVSIN